MFKLFETLLRGQAARAAEEIFDRNALLILDQQIRETRAGLERGRQALAVAVAGDRAEARRLEEAEARIAALEAQAVAALRGGREDLAGEAAGAIADLEAERDALTAARARFAAEIGRIRERVAEATRRQAELERGRRVAAAQEAVRRLGAGAARQDAATLREAEATLARLRALQAEAADTEAALAEAEPGRDIGARLERAGFGPAEGSSGTPTGGAVLERLRRRAAEPAAAAATA
ncbi:hypothetical protein BHAOGJBA_0901 [Methylobacterium hispanicum]|jgi:phage shock protein A|uniref:Phage-shock protein n=1 Tax=Methylobacterium hispanicum TaxID=270350 RepID=A0AAV4ZH36_9HYPH|nr:MULTISPECIES: PspA/IM30 family protein [Methylobacterium]GJD87399.1 hypothetical protein BHAOGJBA_0901 [Methylobacterium hispanicum]